ncbi:peptidyl-tRNA hydrolase [Diplogelasinospora grovesii]|uniref:Peptidyl-tRNA hydrolase n=1 Tax=Diplogelasinospora grovesii TaxID=303347 RepID=A0AAN6N8A3_9PEZI|nr:peptidyl-tRNA hydrolase [Diplogelasinospora grovesii]
MSVSRFLVVSLGNPGEYRDTFHSVGHIALEALQRNVASSEQPPFAPERHGKKSALTSAGPKFTFLQSPTLMNVTGPWLLKAYMQYLADQGLAPEDVGLVLVHDDLEEELGAVKIRKWDKSHGGHNGVRSAQESLKGVAMEPKWARISVGIGRPAARDSAVVSDYVLSKIPRHARSIIDEKASRAVYDALLELERKWGV